MSHDDWESYRVFVTTELKRLSSELAKSDTKADIRHLKLYTKITRLETRMTMWAAGLGAIVSAMVSIAVAYFGG